MQNLVGLKVETVSGAPLGKVCDCVWDSESKQILQIKVKSGIFDTAPLLIHESQIVKILEEKIIVEDTSINGRRKVFAKKGAAFRKLAYE